METIIENNSAPADANVYRLKCIIRCLIFFPSSWIKGGRMEDGTRFVAASAREAFEAYESVTLINFRRNCSLGDRSSSLLWRGKALAQQKLREQITTLCFSSYLIPSVNCANFDISIIASRPYSHENSISISV